jgi:hypothetical protein
LQAVHNVVFIWEHVRQLGIEHVKHTPLGPGVEEKGETQVWQTEVPGAQLWQGYSQIVQVFVVALRVYPIVQVAHTLSDEQLEHPGISVQLTQPPLKLTENPLLHCAHGLFNEH